MKVIFFQATFWSVRRYYQHITILTKGAQDHATVLEMQLPLVAVVNLDLKFNNTLLSGMKASIATSLVHGKLIAKSLDWVAESWAAGGSWAQFQYLYFSVGDQVLHARRLPNLYDALDASLESNFLIAPHRMQTLPLAQSVPPQLRDKLWPVPALNSSAGASTASEFNRTRSSQWQPGAHITTEPLARLTGSCCDEGRILFPSCPRATTLMLPIRLAGALVALQLAAACSPTFNWREVRAEGLPLQALMPCKPDAATRTVPLGGAPTLLHMHSCDTGGLTFTLAWAALSDAAAAPAALDGWRRASLAAIKADPALAEAPAAQVSVNVQGVDRALGLRATGVDHQGRPVQMHALHVSLGRSVFQAAVYGTAPDAEVVGAFFDGVQLP